MEKEHAELLQLFSKLTENDYTYRISSDNELILQANCLAEHLELRMLEQLDDMVEMTMNAFETTMSMGKLEQDINHLDQQASIMANASTAMSDNIAHVAERVEKVNVNIHHASEKSRHANKAVNNATQAIDQINRRVQDADLQVQKLTEASEEIGAILTTIKKISDQTNLLALNATIEAARAGEAGKGFSVVAGEVKTLSQQTKNATENIAQKIQRIQQEILGIKTAMKEIMDAVGHSNSNMAAVDNNIQGMTDTLHIISNEIGQITQATQEQSNAANEVNSAVIETAGMVSNARRAVTNILNDTDAIEEKLVSEIQEFAEMKLRGAILRIAKSDHILWKKRLVNMILDRGTIDISTVASHHDCRLGKWYDSLGKKEYGKLESFLSLEKPHEAVHSLGRRAVERYNKGDKTGAIADVEAIAPLSEKVVMLLDQLITETQNTRAL